MLPRWYYKFALALLIVAVLNTVTIYSVSSRPLYDSLFVYPQNDTMVYEGLPTTNFDTDIEIGSGESNGAANRGLYTYIQYSLSSIPPGSTINSVTLYLTITTDAASSSPTLSVVNVTSSYTSSSVTWNTRPSIGSSLGSISMTASETIGTQKSIPLSPSHFQSVLDGGVNYGIALNSSPFLNDGYFYASSNHSDSSKRPFLSINYTVPTATPTFTPSNTPTLTFTPTLTSAFTATNTPNFTLTFSLTPNVTNTFTPVPTETNTPLPPTVTNTPTATGFPSEIDFPYYLLLILPLLFIDWQTALIWAICSVVPMVSDFLVTLPFEGLEIWITFLIVAFMRRFLFTTSR